MDLTAFTTKHRTGEYFYCGTPEKLSAADARAHLIQNPFAPRFFQGQAVPITLFLVGPLGAVFLKGPR
jgi:hypothetical protein